jgi:hypothetical protein
MNDLRAQYGLRPYTLPPGILTNEQAHELQQRQDYLVNVVGGRYIPRPSENELQNGHDQVRYLYDTLVKPQREVFEDPRVSLVQNTVSFILNDPFAEAAFNNAIRNHNRPTSVVTMAGRVARAIERLDNSDPRLLMIKAQLGMDGATNDELIGDLNNFVRDHADIELAIHEMNASFDALLAKARGRAVQRRDTMETAAAVLSTAGEFAVYAMSALAIAGASYWAGQRARPIFMMGLGMAGIAPERQAVLDLIELVGFDPEHLIERADTIARPISDALRADGQTTLANLLEAAAAGGGGGGGAGAAAIPTAAFVRNLLPDLMAAAGAGAGAAGGAAAEGGAEFAARVLGMPMAPALAAQVMEMVRGMVGGGTTSIAIWTGLTLFTLRICHDMYWASSTPSPRTSGPLRLPAPSPNGRHRPSPLNIAKDLPPSSIPFQTNPLDPQVQDQRTIKLPPRGDWGTKPDEYSLPENPLLGPRPQDQSVVQLPENPLLGPQVQDQSTIKLRRPPRLDITTGDGGDGDGDDGGGGGGGGTTDQIIRPPTPPPRPRPVVKTKRRPPTMWQRARLAVGGLAATAGGGGLMAGLAAGGMATAAGGGVLMAGLAALLLARSKEEAKTEAKKKTKTKTKETTTKTKTKQRRRQKDGPCCRQNVRILLEAHE